ncbi:hypothetical protein MKS88_003319 [Plasmodium brasilianum]|uniref:Uncharacterized protein n=3 Tax=Plasmodium (Plasmodium) TaxID=418103 RepID=A0A1D3RJA7_PLAMA|nr:conserved Plasmodium protein, unknown function [Plasmodium malariae]KAI4837900.1 hypothetical protein MKS88_003319 [Plasmodium brasilianum]SCN45046.1 conserved Plasmodium protein, unknown function [Plasmodium malariae]
MNAQMLKENEINDMILNLIDKKKEVLPKRKKIKKNAKKENFDKNQMKSNVDAFFKEQEQIYKSEETNTMEYIINEAKDKEKELNDYYTYCQNFKKDYNNNFNDVIKHSEEIKKELKDLHIEYIDNKILLENKRKMELDGMFNFYKEKLLDIKRQWDNKTFCDENLKNIVYDILSVIN